jgi:hypothetical protein
MPHDQYSQDIPPEPVLTNITNTGPSFQRASILFAASFGSFIGASLLLASI